PLPIFDRTHGLASLVLVEPDALGAQIGIDHIDLFALGDGLVGALGLASATVDALFGDMGGHLGVSPEVGSAVWMTRPAKGGRAHASGSLPVGSWPSTGLLLRFARRRSSEPSLLPPLRLLRSVSFAGDG